MRFAFGVCGLRRSDGGGVWSREYGDCRKAGISSEGLLGLFWMLPQTFILPFTLNIMCSQVMLMIAAGVAHEAYQMAMPSTGWPMVAMLPIRAAANPMT